LVTILAGFVAIRTIDRTTDNIAVGCAGQ